MIAFNLLCRPVIGYLLPSLAARKAVMKISTRRSYYGKNDFGNWGQRRMKISAKANTTPGENSEATSTPPFVWFVILDGSTGEQFMGTNADAITSPPTDCLVLQFRDAVKAKCPNTLASIDPSSLQVFKNKAAFDDKKSESMKSSASLQGYGLTEEEAVIVVVPSITIAMRTPTLGGKKYSIKTMHMQFQKCLIIAESLNMHAQDKIIKTPSKLFGTVLSNGIFIREEYRQLLDTIKGIRESGKYKRCLILGSRRLGKSVFGILMFILAIKERKNVAYKPKGSGVIYFFTWNNHEFITSVCAEEGKMYEGYLEGNEKCNYFGLECFHFTFLFSNNRRQSNYKEFQKDKCYQIDMNPWCDNECMKFAQLLTLQHSTL
jgi:hypothetical protein